jgi:hypothetical protein
MTVQSTRHLNTDERQSDQEILLALKNISDYAPSNPAYSTAALIALADTLAETKQVKIEAKKMLGIARNQETRAAHALHEGLLNAKRQVIAQYGADSFEIKTLGLKRTSERKRMSRHTPPEA